MEASGVLGIVHDLAKDAKVSPVSVMMCFLMVWQYS